MTIEAAGDAVTGALIGRAVEPGRGEDTPGADGHTREHACLNCRTPLIGGYCHVCGQHAHLHRSLMSFGHDILHGVFHFEGKIWSTIPRLFWHPGDLTRRYIHGERAKFVSPLALFLFSVFLMFATFESIGGPLDVNVSPDASPASAEVRKEKLRNTVLQLNELLASLRAQREVALKAGGSTAEVDARIEAAGRKLEEAAKETARAGGFSIDDVASAAKVDTGSKELDARIREALKNPKLTLYKLQSSAYKFAWALIPLSLPFMWLMFAWKREYQLYDHAVFVTYSLCFVMQLLILMALLRAARLPGDILLLLIPVHFYWQLKTAYALGTGGALVRAFVLVSVTSIVLVAFGAFLVALGLLG